MDTGDIEILATNWSTHEQELRLIRQTVFIDEQQVPESLEWDEFDTQSTHFLVYKNNEPIASARLKPDGQIGRMAVLKNYRHKGIGKKLLSTVILQANNNGFRMLYLHAQKQAIDFYKKYGFRKNGTEFIDAGIAHQAMHLNLK